MDQLIGLESRPDDAEHRLGGGLLLSRAKRGFDRALKERIPAGPKLVSYLLLA